MSKYVPSTYRTFLIGSVIMLISFLFLVYSTGAQTVSNGIIKGLVVHQSKGVEGATVTIHSVPDLRLVKITLTDKAGYYEVQNVATGKYQLAASMTGMKLQLIKDINIAADTSLRLPPIIMEIADKQLQEVTVTSKKPFISRDKNGSIVVNIEASPAAQGSSVLDILEMSPGTVVDNDGRISLKGKQGVLILIDGKATYLSQADLASMLKSMQSSQIETIEIMTNPPARYDAAGNSGIINVRTKKNIITGTNGNITSSLTQGQRTRYNTSVSFNHRNKNTNLFGAYTISGGRGFQDLNIQRTFYENDKTTVNSYASQLSGPRFRPFNNQIKLGLDWYLTDKDIFGAVVSGFYNKFYGNAKGTILVTDRFNTPVYTLNSFTIQNDVKKSLSLNLNYKHSFSKSKELTTDVDFIRYDNRSTSLLETDSRDANNNPIASIVYLSGFLPGSISIYSGKADFKTSLAKAMDFETGFKSSFVLTDNKVDYMRDAGAGYYKDPRSNHFVYKEWINAAYTSLSGKIGKVNYQAGLRAEFTSAEGEQKQNDSAFSRTYLNLFPNLSINYAFHKSHQLSFSYSRRIDRPNYSDLNPFIFFLDSLTYQQGNPYLQPQFTHHFEMNESIGKWNITLNYTSTNNIITSLIKQSTADKISFQTSDNISSLKQFGVAIMYNATIAKLWNLSLFTNLYHNHYKGFYNTDPIDLRFATLSQNITNNFSFKKGWSVEAGGFFRTKSMQGLFIQKPIGVANLGVSKQVLKKAGSLKLAFRDIFFTQRFIGFVRYSDVDASAKNTRDSRVLVLTFNYRFGKKGISAERKRTGGAATEQNRAGGG